MAPRRRTLAIFSCDYQGCKSRLSTRSGIMQHYERTHIIPKDLCPATPPPPQSPPLSPPPFPNQFSPVTPGGQAQPPMPPSTPFNIPLSPNRGGIHINSAGIHIKKHPWIDGTPCDVDGNDIEPGTPPNAQPPQDNEDYFPFTGWADFALSEWVYTTTQLSASKITELLHILAMLYPDDPPPAYNHNDIYNKIDDIEVGGVHWNSFTVSYSGDITPAQDGVPPPWMTQGYEVWYRDPLAVFEEMIGNPEYNGHIDYAPKVVRKDGVRRYKNLMSGKWAWKQANLIAQDPKCHGAMFVPAILGSDKTTVSIATGQTDFYPLYGSIGNVHNSIRRAHKGAVALLGYLAIPKAAREYRDDVQFRNFRRQLFHTSLVRILQSLHPYMTSPRVTLCGDGHYRRVIYGLGPYIADYPEQALLACTVQNWCPKCTATPDNLDNPSGSSRRSHEHTNILRRAFSEKELWDEYGIACAIEPFTMSFPRADIHELLSPDLLHQAIKGTFKDHLVDWVESYIRNVQCEGNPREADRIISDIDRRIACTTPFPGLRHFWQGRGYKQWTGNDSKGLMKVYLPAIAGHVPDDIVKAVASVIEFIYIARRDVIDEDALDELEQALEDFHHYRETFRTLRPEGFSLPRQHSLVHYHQSIELFGAPNGLCTSITENKHIKAIKNPYRRTNRNNPLGQMLVINQREDKVAAARRDFSVRGMLNGSGLPAWMSENQELLPLPPHAVKPSVLPDDDELERESGAVNEPLSQSEVKLAKTAVRKVPKNIYEFAQHIGQERLPELTQRYLYDVINPGAAISGHDAPVHLIPSDVGTVRLFNSARAVFYAPSDLSGVGGMHQERIRAVSSWYHGARRHDCVFVGADNDEPGFRGLNVARVHVFFSVHFRGKTYPCALVHWFSHVGEEPDPVTGLWKVTPDWDVRGEPVLSVISVDSIFRGAHLIGVCGPHFLPRHKFDLTNALDAFREFYVNKYVDNHAHEIAF